MRTIDFISNVIIDGDNVLFDKEIIESNNTPVFNKLYTIRKYFEDKEVTKILTVDAIIENTQYIVGFDPSMSYFYFFNCSTIEIDYFISKEEKQDSSYLCLIYPFLRKEMIIDR